MAVLEPEETLQAIVSKLSKFQDLDEPTTSMLKALLRYTEKHPMYTKTPEF